MPKTTATDKKGPKQAALMPPPDGEYKQKDITGTKDIRRTAPKAVQDAADYWFGKKVEFARAKNNAEKAAEDLLKVMEKHEVTMCTVFDSEAQCKKIVTIRMGEERLKVEKVKDNEPQTVNVND